MVGSGDNKNSAILNLSFLLMAREEEKLGKLKSGPKRNQGGVGAVEGENGFQEKWMIGIAGSSLALPVELEAEATTLSAAVQTAASQLQNGIVKSYEHLLSIITGAISVCNLSGPLGIAETTGDVVQQGNFELISTIAFISLGLAFINLVPIPPLDGFHIVFAATTWMFGHEVTNKLSHYFGMLGFAIFIGVFMIVSWNDIFCL